MAVTLTHNAPASLARCLDAMARQSRPPDAVLVVDNASDPPVEASALDAGELPVEVVRSDVNTGPAGGYELALRRFLETGYPFAWVLDDDMRPEPDCLELLWDRARRTPASAFVFPRSRQSDGSVAVWPSWCGFVIARDIVAEVGLPDPDLFWWAEDTEYLQWRIPQAGYPVVVVEQAIVDHDAIRQTGGMPMWKYYYESRNMLYVHLYLKRKIGRYPRSLALLLARALIRERTDRAERLRVMARGVSDGLRGRLGVTFPISDLHERQLAGEDGSPAAP
jgi:GT2 family glycosyltransferase